jgi:5,5'-dehydrodivanillate O-demethylase oxygenase subunit
MAVANGKLKQAKKFTNKDWKDFVHVGPGTLAGEYLRRFWHPIFLSRDLSAGRAMPVKLLGEDFTLYRGETGEVHAVDFRCAHRLTQLNTGWVEGDTIRCRYHGWVYDANGQCVEQPAEPRPFCEKVRIRSFPAYDYLGLIYVYLGEGAPPPKPHYPDFEVEGVRRNSIHLRNCSFFNNLENSCDEVHLSFTHKGAFGEYMETLPDEIWGEETEYGIARYGRRPGGNVRIEHIRAHRAHPYAEHAAARRSAPWARQRLGRHPRLARSPRRRASLHRQRDPLPAQA